MSYSHSDVADAFGKGRSRTGSRMWTDGRTVYSYGSHFPIAIWIRFGYTVAFNVDYYSSTTSRHQSLVRSEIHNIREVIELDTARIKEVERQAHDDTVIMMELPYYSRDKLSVDDLWKILKLRLQYRGVKEGGETYRMIEEFRQDINKEIFIDLL